MFISLDDSEAIFDPPYCASSRLGLRQPQALLETSIMIHYVHLCSPFTYMTYLLVTFTISAEKI